MGDRALIQLKCKNEVSPALYLHWEGYAVAYILLRTKKRMEGRADDLQYTFARLVQEATMGDEGNLSFGVFNQPTELTEKDSPGDAGAFVVELSEGRWRVKCMGGYGINKGAREAFEEAGILVENA